MQFALNCCVLHILSLYACYIPEFLKNTSCCASMGQTLFAPLKAFIHVACVEYERATRFSF